MFYFFTQTPSPIDKEGTTGSIVAWRAIHNNQVSGTPIGNDFVAVATDHMHIAALRKDGSIVAWGQDTE